MELNYKTTLDMSGTCAYAIEEIVDWCFTQCGTCGYHFRYEETNPNIWTFYFPTNKEMVRFGLTWNKITIKYKPRPWH